MKNSTLIALIIDRSGSIRDVLPQMQAAVTEFISAQKQVPGECDLVLVDFDTEYRQVYKGPLADAPDYRIEPRGSTALHDAVGLTINAVGQELAALPESERPNKVMFVIITDGFENASREFSGADIKRMITHQTEVYNWNFDYLGANQDAILVGASMGIVADSCLSFMSTSHAATSSVSASLGAKAATYRSTGVYKGYDDAERLAAMTPDDPAEVQKNLDNLAKVVQNKTPKTTKGRSRSAK